MISNPPNEPEQTEMQVLSAENDLLREEIRNIEADHAATVAALVERIEQIEDLLSRYPADEYPEAMLLNALLLARDALHLANVRTSAPVEAVREMVAFIAEFGPTLHDEANRKRGEQILARWKEVTGGI